MNRRLIIIDDDDSILEMLRSVLGEAGYEVITETSPEAALGRLATGESCVVLTDLRMRGMSGMDLCREVVALEAATPVIVMTAFGGIESAMAAIRAGAYDFVTKPLDADQLIPTIERAFAHHELRAAVRRLRRRETDAEAPVSEEDASRAERCLLTSVCHDLRAPLAAIEMGVGFLRRVPQPDEAARLRVVEAMDGSVRQMNRLIETLTAHERVAPDATTGGRRSSTMPVRASPRRSSRKRNA